MISSTEWAIQNQQNAYDESRRYLQGFIYLAIICSLLASQHFWGKIISRPNSAVWPALKRGVLGKAKITYPGYRPLTVVQEDVFHLNVSMCKAPPVHIVYSNDELLEEPPISKWDSAEALLSHQQNNLELDRWHIYSVWWRLPRWSLLQPTILFDVMEEIPSWDVVHDYCKGVWSNKNLLTPVLSHKKSSLYRRLVCSC